MEKNANGQVGPDGEKKDLSAALVLAVDCVEIELVDVLLDRGVRLSRSQAIRLNESFPMIVGYILSRDGVDLQK
jgi:hypothetical protein